MYKNLLKSITFAALALVAGACAKEQVASGDGETVEMTFNVDVPETTITTKGLSDAAQVDELVFQVFLTSKTKDEKKHFVNTPVPELTQVVPVVDKKATVRVNLVKGQRYSYAFWAQSKGTGYYDTSDLRAVKMNTDKVKANDPKMDAFYWFREGETASKSYSGYVKLYRALAQINFGAKALDRSDALQATASSVTLSKAPDIFHPFWKTSEGEGSITYANNIVISDEKLVIADKTDKTEYDYLATAYVFANKEKSILIDAAATITLSNGKTTEVAVPNAPIQVNYRTNILGDLLNFDGVWNISIDEEFKGGDWIYDPVGSELKKGAAVTLTEDYSAFKSSGVVIPMNVASSLDLNGYTFKTEKGTALDVRGSLTINGSGKVLCEGPVGEAHAAVFVEDGGKVVINDGYYYSKNGNSCIYVQAGKVTGNTITIGGEVKPLYYGGGIVEINGGVFEAEASKFVLNQNDYIENESCFSVKGGIFVGFNPAEVNECHGKVKSFVADGYKAVETTYEGKQAWKVEAIPPVTTQEAFNSAIAEANATVVLAAGTYDMPSTIADGVTIIGGGDETVLDMVHKNRSYTNVAFKNIKILNGQSDYYGFQNSGNLLFEGCTFTGKHFSYGKETYKKCKFIQDASDYNMWVYGKDVDYIDCTFEGKGKFLNVFNEGNPLITVNIQGCKFISTVSNKPAINIKGTSTTSEGVVTVLQYTVNIDKCTVSGAFPEINGGLWQVDDPANAENNKITVNVNGKKVYLN